MNPFLSNELAAERIRDLRAEASRASRRPDKEPAKDEHSDSLTVRRFVETDIDAIRMLAALDEKSVPTGSVLVAELDGELVAALSIEDGQVLADPWKRTAGIVTLLRLRATQLSDKAVVTRRLPARLSARLQHS